MSDFYCDEIISSRTKVDILFETDLVMAFHHTQPYFEQHIVIIPKEHLDSLSSYPNTAALNHDMFAAIVFVTAMLEKKFGACRVSSNVGNYQSTKHLHWYVHFGNRLRAENGDVLKVEG